jgi:hypothetical protein
LTLRSQRFPAAICSSLVVIALQWLALNRSRVAELLGGAR